MVCDFAHVGFTAEIPLPNQGFPARFLGTAAYDTVSSSPYSASISSKMLRVLWGTIGISMLPMSLSSLSSS